MEQLSGQLTAAVAVSGTAYSFDRLFDYAVPEAYADLLAPGFRVIVPFGRGNRKRLGFVMRIQRTDATVQLKPIFAVPDKEAVMDEELRELVEWLHETTFCTYYDAVKTILPTGMSFQLHETFALAEVPADMQLSEAEENLLRFLKLAKSSRELDAMLDTGLNPDKQEAVASLQQKGIIVPVSECKRNVQDCFLPMIRLSEAYLSGADKHTQTPKQRQVIQLLTENQAVSVKEACYLCNVTQAVIKNLLKTGTIEQYDIEQFRCAVDTQAKPAKLSDTVLTAEQQEAFDAVAAQLAAQLPKVFLLHGVTGSGKTSVFEKLIARTLSEGKNAILMIPEISLTPQVVSRFQALFGEIVALIHSNLSLGQRLDEYKRIRQGKARIVIGTRSAVFAPLSDIGLIIMDEEGERSYKSDSAPRYHAVDVAKRRCKTHGAVLLLASATPSVESYYYAQKGYYTLLEMKGRFGDAPLPDVLLVDMNEERARGNATEFSNRLVEELQRNLDAGEQSIVLLNRRGYHTIISCMDCNQPVECPNCSVPLTYHKANGSMMCHYCGHSQPPVTVCPSCGSAHLRQMGFGTQKLEDELERLFPSARILRMDADTTFSRLAYEQRFAAFGRGEYDMMIGTQMIGKGLNFPNVTLVGVLSIDKALFSGDFRSYERTFSLITQVVGRGGRGDKPGRAILQSFLPEHYVLQLAAKQDYTGFFREEIALRK